MFKRALIAAAPLMLLAPPAAGGGQEQLPPEATEQWTPVPKIVAPGPYPGAMMARPSDAIVLFDGRNLREWVSVNDRSKPSGWTLANRVMVVNKKAGNIETRRRFTNYQLHLEWRIPPAVGESGQGRGNSGLFLASTGPGDSGYELQILDSYGNKTYVNGQAGSVYKQFAPLANAMRPNGQWQTYDVVWTAPVFNVDGSVKSPAYLTAFHNGVLIQDHVALTGETVYQGKPRYTKHGPSPIKLQAHGDPSAPISFRNIWIREL